jgi:hypothetical protein
MRFKSFKLGMLKGKSEEDTEDAEEEEIEEQAGNEAEKDEEPQPGPHGPLSELTVEPQDTVLDEDADVSGLLDESGEDVKIVEVSAEAVAAEETEKEEDKEKEEEPPKEGDDESFNNLFSSDEEEVNPLANLISSLPDVTTRELLDDLREINELLQDRQQK